MVCKSAWVRLSAFSLFSSRKNQNQEKVQWLKNIIPSIIWMVLNVIWQEKKEKHKLRYCSCSICHFGLNCLPLFLLSFPWLILIFIPPCQLFPSFSLPFPFLFFFKFFHFCVPTVSQFLDSIIPKYASSTVDPFPFSAFTFIYSFLYSYMFLCSSSKLSTSFPLILHSVGFILLNASTFLGSLWDSLFS